MFAHNSRLFTPFAASHCRSVSFTIKNIFKIKLAETEMSPEAAARQAEIDDGVRQLLRTAKPVHRDNVLASALASPMRQCVIHKYALPSAFLLRFICAYNGNQVGPRSCRDSESPAIHWRIHVISGDNHI
jgi:hypothetical protein